MLNAMKRTSSHFGRVSNHWFPSYLRKPKLLSHTGYGPSVAVIAITIASLGASNGSHILMCFGIAFPVIASLVPLPPSRR